jgi:hypothetical protein
MNLSTGLGLIEMQTRIIYDLINEDTINIMSSKVDSITMIHFSQTCKYTYELFKKTELGFVSLAVTKRISPKILFDLPDYWSAFSMTAVAVFVGTEFISYPLDWALYGGLMGMTFFGSIRAVTHPFSIWGMPSVAGVTEQIWQAGNIGVIFGSICGSMGGLAKALVVTASNETPLLDSLYAGSKLLGVALLGGTLFTIKKDMIDPLREKISTAREHLHKDNSTVGVEKVSKLMGYRR